MNDDFLLNKKHAGDRWNRRDIPPVNGPGAKRMKHRVGEKQKLTIGLKRLKNVRQVRRVLDYW